ncbi:MAG TPA: GNAT family N-acetyltransferase [Chloroflexota bacterium]|nr:GNAT family N-acetyltransferase [Chloroflexota bacterium]
MAVDVVPYDPDWLPSVASLARVHARLCAPHLVPSDEEVAAGLERHAFWRFYTPSLESAQTLLAVEDGELLAAAQTGFVGYGWGYGAAPGDGPDWLHEVHCSVFWLFAWPGVAASSAAAGHLAAAIVSWARQEGLPGVEAFRGGPGFMRFGTQLSSRWPHLWAPLRAAGFRQPRDLLVFGGRTQAEALPPADAPEGLTFRARAERVEAWLDDTPVGVCSAHALTRFTTGDPRGKEWAAIRRLAVEPAVRRRGVGTALLSEQLRRLSARGVKRYLLHIPDDQDEQAALALYAKFGRLIDRQQVLRISF